VEIFLVPAQGVQTCCYVVYTVEVHDCTQWKRTSRDKCGTLRWLLNTYNGFWLVLFRYAYARKHIPKSFRSRSEESECSLHHVLFIFVQHVQNRQNIDHNRQYTTQPSQELLPRLNDNMFGIKQRDHDGDLLSEGPGRRIIGLCCKIAYNLEIEVKIMTFELCFMRRGNFFLEGAGMWFGNGNEIQQSWEWEWEWELIHGNGRELESKTHSRTPLIHWCASQRTSAVCLLR